MGSIHFVKSIDWTACQGLTVCLACQCFIRHHSRLYASFLLLTVGTRHSPCTGFSWSQYKMCFVKVSGKTMVLNTVYMVVIQTSHLQSLLQFSVTTAHLWLMVSNRKKHSLGPYLFPSDYTSFQEMATQEELLEKSCLGHGDRSQMLRMAETFY